MKWVTDLDLIFGVLAAQLGKVGADQLIEAIQEQLRGREEPLSSILESRGQLTPDDREELDRLVVGRLRAHGNDTGQLLSSLGAEALLADLACRVDGDGPTSPETPSRIPFQPTERQALAETIDYDENADRETQSFVSKKAEGNAAGNGEYGSNGSGHSNGSSWSSGGRFRLLSFHAKGGIGEVYRAEDEELGRVVALKRLQPKYAGNKTYRSRFVIEAEINGNLEHPGIVPVHGFGFDQDGRPYYAMRMVRGETLHKALVDHHRTLPTLDERERSLRLRKLLARFIVVCEALAYAHHRGVLHRDLKPSNIMLGRYGETQIIDWGLAKATGHSDPSSSFSDDQPEPAVQPASGSGHDPTRAGSVIGTLAYISPEAAAGESETLGVPCDIYGLGAILFAILTGRPPAQGKDDSETRRIALENAIPSPRSLVPDLPRPLDAICMKALAGKPGDRYASALDLAEDLRRWMADEPVSALEDRFADRVARWERAHRTLVRVGSAASVLIAAVSVVAVLLIASAQHEAEAARDQAEDARIEAQANAEAAINATLRAEAARIEAQANAEAADEARQFAEAERQLAEARHEEIRAIVEEFLEPMVDGLYLIPGSAPLRVAMAGTLVSQYREFLRLMPEDAEIREQAARIFRIAANIERMTGKDEPAGLLYDEGLALADRLDDPMPGAWLLLDRSEWHQMNGRIADAVADLDAAEVRARDAGRPEQEPGEERRSLFDGILALNRSGLQFLMGRFEEAEASARFADEWFTGLLDPKNPATMTKVLQLFSKANWLAGLREQGKIEEAAAEAEEVFAMARNFYNPRTFDPHAAIAYAGVVQEWSMLPAPVLKNPPFLLSRLDQVVMARSGLFNPNKDIATFRIGLIGAYIDRAESRLKLGQPGVESDAGQVFTLIENAPEPIRSLPSMQRELGRAEELLAKVAVIGGDRDGERGRMESALAAFAAASDRDPDRFHDRRDAERLRSRLAGGGPDDPAPEPEGRGPDDAP